MTDPRPRVRITETIRGKTWELELISIQGTKLEFNVAGTGIGTENAGFLTVSLWTAAILEIPGAKLSEESIATLSAVGVKWRIGWKRKRAKPKAMKEKPADPRQTEMFK